MSLLRVVQPPRRAGHRRGGHAVPGPGSFLAGGLFVGCAWWAAVCAEAAATRRLCKEGEDAGRATAPPPHFDAAGQCQWCPAPADCRGSKGQKGQEGAHVLKPSDPNRVSRTGPKEREACFQKTLDFVAALERRPKTSPEHT